MVAAMAVVAVVLAIVTRGFALPVIFGLLAVAVADVNRALMLRGLTAGRRMVAVGLALVVAGFRLGLLLSIAVLFAVAGVGVGRMEAPLSSPCWRDARARCSRRAGAT